MSKSKFENLFYKHLLEDDMTDRQAMISTLDDDTDPNSFDGSQPDPQGAENEVAKAISQRQAEMVTKVKEWSDKMEEFIEYLNGTEGSIQTALSQAEADTLFDKMKNSEQRKIARVATELAGLAQSFKGYVAQASNPSLKYV